MYDDEAYEVARRNTKYNQKGEVVIPAEITGDDIRRVLYKKYTVKGERISN